MTEEIGNPHDAFFKRLFGRVELSREFFRRFLPEKVMAELALERLELAKGSFVDDHLRQSHSDLLFRTVLKSGDDAFIYLLFEHQSTPERDMPFRLWRYLGNVWDQHKGQHPGEDTLPVIVPMVLYHGLSSWDVPRCFSEGLNFRGDLGVRPPELEYVLIDLSRIPDEQLREAVQDVVELGIGLVLMKHVRDHDFTGFFKGLIPFLNQLGTRQTHLETIETLIRYVYHTRDEKEWNDVVDVLHESEPFIEEAGLTTIAEHLMQKGEERGRQKWLELGRREGWQEGRQEGQLILARQMLVEFLQDRFGALPPPMLETIFEVRDPEVLVALLRKLKTCSSIEDFKRLLERNGS